MEVIMVWILEWCGCSGVWWQRYAGPRSVGSWRRTFLDTQCRWIQTYVSSTSTSSAFKSAALIIILTY